VTMKRYNLIPISEEWAEYERERERKHAEVVLRGPVVWRLELSAEFSRMVAIYQEGSRLETERWIQVVEVSALYARDAVEGVARSLPHEFDDLVVRVTATGPDGVAEVFEVDTEVIRQRSVMAVEP
jgi:hypothetical protein